MGRLGVITGLESLTPAWSGGIVSIGNFDGVHAGHQAIMARCRARAADSGGPVIAVTFDPHPLVVLRPEQAPALLTPLDEKSRLLMEAGADGVLVLGATASLLSQTADEFIDGVLVGRLAPRCIVEGESFRFGRDRRGTVELLRERAAAAGFEVESVPGVLMDARAGGGPTVVSSSAIRRLLEQGEVEPAARCLGRGYRLFGRVMRGEGLGRELAAPTANLDCGPQQVPGDGVYAGVGKLGDRPFAAAISIGSRPTFAGTGRVVEVHLLDAAGDYYGRNIVVEFRVRLRDQVRFETTDALREQIAHDLAGIRSLIHVGDQA